MWVHYSFSNASGACVFGKTRIYLTANIFRATLPQPVTSSAYNIPEAPSGRSDTSCLPAAYQFAAAL
ncbi:MAG: hypothetical protein IPJ82_05805 [Lewinellaceae bacterium]|nr:hypothetical protein [Lewinellaceae bacterium]